MLSDILSYVIVKLNNSVSYVIVHTRDEWCFIFSDDIFHNYIIVMLVDLNDPSILQGYLTYFFWVRFFDYLQVDDRLFFESL